MAAASADAGAAAAALDRGAMGTLPQWIEEANSMPDPGDAILSGTSGPLPQAVRLTNMFRILGNKLQAIWDWACTTQARAERVESDVRGPKARIDMNEGAIAMSLDERDTELKLHIEGIRVMLDNMRANLDRRLTEIEDRLASTPIICFIRGGATSPQCKASR